MMKYLELAVENKPNREEMIKIREAQHVEWEKKYKKEMNRSEVVINGKLMTPQDFIKEALDTDKYIDEVLLKKKIS
jgi:hypothetical protein